MTTAADERMVERLVASSRSSRITGYLRLLAVHATPRRLYNIVLNEWEYRIRRDVLRSMPPQLTLDVTNVCPLRCPLCATGARMLGQEPMFITPADAERIIKRFCQDSFHVFLYCWGEPLLHPRLGEIIRIAGSFRMAVTLSTNLQPSMGPGRAEEIVASGPDVIIASIDGLTQRTYGRYRVGGSLDAALRNLDELRRARERLGKRRPRLVWQTLIFRHNLSELPAMIERHRDLGADEISFESPNLLFGRATPEEADEWLIDPGPESWQHDVKDNVRGHCWWPYRSAIIGADGSVAPCCYTFGQDARWGNALEVDFSRIWNSERFVRLRRAFKEPGAALPEPCDICSVPRRYAPFFNAPDKDRV